MKKKVSAIWSVILSIFFLYLLYQTTYAWDELVDRPEAETKISEEKTAFIMISDFNNFGLESSGIKSLQESLEMWSFDKKREKVLIKHKNLLPKLKTQMMIIYDKGYTSFEKHSEVLSLLRFPYTYFYKEEPIFTIEGINENGEVYLSYRSQRIYLKPGEAYHIPSFEGFRPTITRIKNYGLYDKKQFILEEEDRLEKEMEKANKPKKINTDTLEIMPLSEVPLTNTP